MKSFKGVVKARIVSLRFAASGKVSRVNKFAGDTVKKQDLIASLDRKILQTGLDRQLADYEKVRADFEIFGQKYPNPQEAIDKYLKTEKEAALTASVKDVELAKAVLDQCDLFSPVDGIVMDDSGITAGIFTTPAGSEVKIIDTSSFYFEIEIGQKDIPYFSEPRKCKVDLDGIKKDIEAETSPVFSDGKKFSIRIPIAFGEGILLGLNGKANC